MSNRMPKLNIRSEILEEIWLVNCFFLAGKWPGSTSEKARRNQWSNGLVLCNMTWVPFLKSSEKFSVLESKFSNHDPLVLESWSFNMFLRPEKKYICKVFSLVTFPF